MHKKNVELKLTLFYTLFTQNALLLYIYIFSDFGINTGRMTTSVYTDKPENNQISDNIDVYHIIHTVSAIEQPIGRPHFPKHLELFSSVRLWVLCEGFPAAHVRASH